MKLILPLLLSLSALAGVKDTVMATTGAEIVTRGQVTNFRALVGANEADDGCTVEAGATDFNVNRAAGGITLCGMASSYALGSGCAVGANSTVVCSGDPVNATNLANCSVSLDTPTNSTAECN
jgi:hypothetical protein